MGIPENEDSNNWVTVHPNPTSGFVSVKGENLRLAEVVNMLGQKVLCVEGNGNELHLDITTLPAGMYFVNVTNEEGKNCVRKVLKE